MWGRLKKGGLVGGKLEGEKEGAPGVATSAEKPTRASQSGESSQYSHSVSFGSGKVPGKEEHEDSPGQRSRYSVSNSLRQDDTNVGHHYESDGYSDGASIYSQSTRHDDDLSEYSEARSRSSTGRGDSRSHLARQPAAPTRAVLSAVDAAARYAPPRHSQDDAERLSELGDSTGDGRLSEAGDDDRLSEVGDLAAGPEHEGDRLSEAGGDEGLDLDGFVNGSNYSQGAAGHDPSWPPPKPGEEEAEDEEEEKKKVKKKKIKIETTYIKTKTFGAVKCYVFGPSKKTAKGFIFCVPGMARNQTATWHVVADILSEDGWRVYCPDMYGNVATRSHDLGKGAQFIHEALVALKSSEWKGTWVPMTKAQARVAAARRSVAAGEKIFAHWLPQDDDAPLYSRAGPDVAMLKAKAELEARRKARNEAHARARQGGVGEKEEEEEEGAAAGGGDKKKTNPFMKKWGKTGAAADKGKEGEEEEGEEEGKGTAAVKRPAASAKLWGRAADAAEKGDLQDEEERDQLLVLAGRGWGGGAVSHYVSKFPHAVDRLILQAPATKSREVIEGIPDDLDVLLTWNEDDLVNPFSDITMWEEELAASLDFYPFEEGGSCDPTPEFGEICIHFLNETLGIYDEMVAEREEARDREESLSDAGDFEGNDDPRAGSQWGSRYQGGSIARGLDSTYEAGAVPPMPPVVPVGGWGGAGPGAGPYPGSDYGYGPRGGGIHDDSFGETESEVGMRAMFPRAPATSYGDNDADDDRSSMLEGSELGRASEYSAPTSSAYGGLGGYGPPPGYSRGASLSSSSRRHRAPPSEAGSDASGFSKASEFVSEGAPGRSSGSIEPSPYALLHHPGGRLVRENPLYDDAQSILSSSSSAGVPPSELQYPRGPGSTYSRYSRYATPSEAGSDVTWVAHSVDSDFPAPTPAGFGHQRGGAGRRRGERTASARSPYAPSPRVTKAWEYGGDTASEAGTAQSRTTPEGSEYSSSGAVGGGGRGGRRPESEVGSGYSDYPAPGAAGRPPPTRIDSRSSAGWAPLAEGGEVSAGRAPLRRHDSRGSSGGGYTSQGAEAGSSSRMSRTDSRRSSASGGWTSQGAEAGSSVRMSRTDSRSSRSTMMSRMDSQRSGGSALNRMDSQRSGGSALKTVGDAWSDMASDDGTDYSRSTLASSVRTDATRSSLGRAEPDSFSSRGGQLAPSFAEGSEYSSQAPKRVPRAAPRQPPSASRYVGK